MELQGAIVLGTMDCSNAYVRKVSDGSSRFVTLLYDQSAAMRVLGNLLVAVAALLVHCVAVVAVRLHGGCSTVGEAAAKCRFPGLSHRIFVLCFQGLLLESLRGLCVTRMTRLRWVLAFAAWSSACACPRLWLCSVPVRAVRWPTRRTLLR